MFRFTLGPPCRKRTLVAPVFTVSQLRNKKRRINLKAGDVVRKTVLIVHDSVFVGPALCEVFTRHSDLTYAEVPRTGVRRLN
jgi:hypothetical protein